MRILVQRSLDSNVSVDNKIVGKIDKGIVAFVSFTHNDTEEDINYLVNKLLNLRIFEDQNGIMNLSVKDIKGQILSISQFTLYADTKKGNRPSYINSLNYKDAEILYNEFNERLKKYITVEEGIFRSDMKVSITNDGPVTIMLESRK